MIGFAILTVYMLFAAGWSAFHSPELEAHLSVYLAVVGIENVESQGGLDDASAVFGNKIFRNIVLSLAATYGLYIIASILALEPWHMCKQLQQQ